MKILKAVALFCVVAALGAATIGDSHRKGLSEVFSGIGGTKGGFAPLPDLPNISFLDLLYPMDATSGSNLLNVSANSRNQPLTGASVVNADGSRTYTVGDYSEYIALITPPWAPQSPDYMMNAVYPFTLTFDIYLVSGTDNFFMSTTDQLSDVSGYYIYFNGTTKTMVWHQKGGTADPGYNYDLTFTIPNGYWDGLAHSFALINSPGASPVGSPGTALMYLYLDENLIDTKARNGRTLPPRGWEAYADPGWYINAYHAFNGFSSYDCHLRDFSFWTTVFTTDQIHTLHDIRTVRHQRLRSLLNL